MQTVLYANHTRILSSFCLLIVSHLSGSPAPYERRITSGDILALVGLLVAAERSVGAAYAAPVPLRSRLLRHLYCCS